LEKKRKGRKTHLLRSPGHVVRLVFLDELARSVSEEAMRRLELGNDVLKEESLKHRGKLFLRVGGRSRSDTAGEK
jgi:hypothetical protein